LAFHILIALGNGPAHGYAIGRDVEEQSGGRLDPSTGTLYQALHRLKERLIASIKAAGTLG
jgi:DNA-binding PadR family transcriptional regulator